MQVSTSLIGQDNLSTTNFLATAAQQQSIQVIQQKIDFQQAADYSINWFNELEFRTETNDFDFSKQEYTLRVKPNTKRQINAQNQFHQASINVNEIELDLAFKKGLVLRYKWLIDILKTEQDLVAKKTLEVIATDKLNVLKQSTGDINFKVKDLIKAEDDLQEIETDIFKLEQKKSILNSQLSYFSNTVKSVVIPKKDLITLPQIQLLLANQNLDFTNHIALARKQSRLQLIEKETEIEQSKIKNPINYAQVKLGGNNNDLFTEYISFGLGINLPEIGNDKLDLNELALDKIEEQGEYDLLKTELEQRQERLIQGISQLIAEQEFLKKQLENSQAKFTYEQLLQLDDANPLDILDLKEILVKKENAIQKLDIQILEWFVEWLDASDKIMTKPLKNYLLQSQEVIPVK